MGMPIRSTVVEAAAARGWSKVELAQKTGLSLSTIYNLESALYTPSGATIAAIMRVFPDLPYERLFVPVVSSQSEPPRTILQPVEAA